MEVTSKRKSWRNNGEQHVREGRVGGGDERDEKVQRMHVQGYRRGRRHGWVSLKEHFDFDAEGTGLTSFFVVMELLR